MITFRKVASTLLTAVTISLLTITGPPTLQRHKFMFMCLNTELNLTLIFLTFILQIVCFLDLAITSLIQTFYNAFEFSTKLAFYGISLY